MKALVNLLTTAMAISLVAMPAAVFAHHSTSEYDQTVKVEIEGSIARKFWKNPHVIFHITTIENGQEEEWIVEGSSVSGQNRQGITSDVINVGDMVKVAGYVSTEVGGL